MRFLRENPDQVLQRLGEHVQIVALSVAAAILIGIPLGVFVTRARWLQGPVILTTGVLYTVPSLALFALLIPYTGIGRPTAVVALVVYSLLVIVRNTVAGIDGVPPVTLDAARGMGMTGPQRLRLVELPLALPVILAGVRLATVATVGTATIAAAIGAGGLGRLIFDGMDRLDSDRIAAGAVPAAGLALLADWGLGRIGRILQPGRRSVAEGE